MKRNVSGSASDDPYEMTTTHDFTDRDLDALFSGRAVNDARLAELVPAMTALRAEAAVTPSDEQVSAMALALSQAVPPPTPAPAATAQRAPRGASTLSRRLVAIVASAGLLGVGFAGAAAADGAAPGDALYGLDRALEAVGVNDGGAQERLLEVRALLDAGDIDGALLHAEEATDELDPEATESLRAAAAAVASAGSDQSGEVREQVAAMLAWMADTDLDGREFGQAVADQARSIGQKADPETGTSTPGNGSAPAWAGKPETAGKPDTAGQPADKGSSGNAGNSGNAGKPDTAGPPADKGNSGNSGKPDTAGPPADKGDSGNSGRPDTAGPPADKGKP